KHSGRNQNLAQSAAAFSLNLESCSELRLINLPVMDEELTQVFFRVVRRCPDDQPALEIDLLDDLRSIKAKPAGLPAHRQKLQQIGDAHRREVALDSCHFIGTRLT